MAFNLHEIHTLKTIIWPKTLINAENLSLRELVIHKKTTRANGFLSNKINEL